jgi:hypothetical protein
MKIAQIAPLYESVPPMVYRRAQDSLIEFIGEIGEADSCSVKEGEGSLFCAL